MQLASFNWRDKVTGKMIYFFIGCLSSLTVTEFVESRTKSFGIVRKKREDGGRWGCLLVSADLVADSRKLYVPLCPVFSAEIAGGMH